MNVNHTFINVHKTFKAREYVFHRGEMTARSSLCTNRGEFGSVADWWAEYFEYGVVQFGSGWL